MLPPAFFSMGTSPGNPALSPTSAATEQSVESPTRTSPAATPAPVAPIEPPANETTTLLLIGTVNLANKSLLVSTLLIAFLDGFNPCSIWVLSMLLAITLNTHSRKRVLVIGLVFILVTGLIYALFNGGLFTVFKVIDFLGWLWLSLPLFLPW